MEFISTSTNEINDAPTMEFTSTTNKIDHSPAMEFTTISTREINGTPTRELTATPNGDFTDTIIEESATTSNGVHTANHTRKPAMKPSATSAEVEIKAVKSQKIQQQNRNVKQSKENVLSKKSRNQSKSKHFLN